MLKSNWLKIVLSIVLLAALILLVDFIFKEPLKVLTINGKSIKIVFADDAEEIAIGLSGKSSLCPNCGMLFVFPDYQVRNFWMKEMNFPLDIVWLRDSTIVGWQENISPVDETGESTRMSSNQPINRVLELNAGWLKQNSVKIGDKVSGLD